MGFNPFDHPILMKAPGVLAPPTAWRGHTPFALLIIDLIRPKLLVKLGTDCDRFWKPTNRS